MRLMKVRKEPYILYLKRKNDNFLYYYELCLLLGKKCY